MDNDIMKEQGLRDIYYSPKSGFQTPEKLYLRAISDGLEVTRSQVKKWINEQDTCTRYRQVFRRHKFRQTFVQTLGEQLQMDLVDMSKYDDKNKGYRWILTSIEILSRYAFTVPVQRKNATAMKDAVSTCLEQFKNHFGKYPKFVQFDQGTEFYNKDVKSLLNKHNIEFFSTYSNKKAAVVERFNRTLKGLWYHEQQKTRFQFNITVYSLNINHLTVLHSPKPKIRMLNVSCCFPVCPLTNISKYVMSAHILWVLHHPPPSL